MKQKNGKEKEGVKLWKRNAVVAAIVLFVCAAVYLNWSYAKEEEQAGETGKNLGQATLVDGAGDSLLRESAPPEETGSAGEGTGSGYFEKARLNRQQARDSALSILKDAAANESTAADARAEAEKAIQTMAGYTATEAQIENLVMAKGYADCVAFISDGSVSVVVPAAEDGLTGTDTARITDIVTGETGFAPKQVKIITAD